MSTQSLTDQLRLLEEEITKIEASGVPLPYTQTLLAVAKGFEKERDQLRALVLQNLETLDKLNQFSAEYNATIAALRAENDRQAQIIRLLDKYRLNHGLLHSGTCAYRPGALNLECTCGCDELYDAMLKPAAHSPPYPNELGDDMSNEVFEAINEAARDLPKKCEIHIVIEKDGAYINAYDKTGGFVDFDEHPELEDSIRDALRHII